MFGRRWGVVASLALLALAGCGSPSGDSAATTVPGSVATTGTTATAVGGSDAPEALQFSAPLVGGGELDLRQYAGRTVALWFWAPT